jgi:hypothetical protein
MKVPTHVPRVIVFTFLCWLLCPALGRLLADETGRQIPDPLKSWQDWATWDDQDRKAPTPYGDPTKHLSSWPSLLDLKVDHAAGQFDLALTVFHDSWIPLPGSTDTWPEGVKANGLPVPVVEHDDKPSIHLTTGVYHVTGGYRWDEMPERVFIPQDIGVLSLSIEGKKMDAATWDADGFLWLKRDRAVATDKNFLGIKIYRMIEDGIPMWLHTQVELSVAGKSREEDLKFVLPEGWQLAAVDSPLPVVIDENGHMKAQVRAGKWVVHLDAFHLTPVTQFGFAADATPLVKEELVAFKAAPDFRMVEVQDIPSIDVSQTTFPQEWRDLPVYHWETGTPFHLLERMRGMGLQKPQGLSISRELWMDEKGEGLTFRDHITGQAQQIWRLDVTKNEDLGSVKISGQGQLITRNPEDGASGIEIRSRDLDLQATGRMARARTFSATGWRTSADSVQVTLNLPPGWRLFALFGADWVQGDWLTAWSLLDLFLLLIFTIAIYRMSGLVVAALAFCAFGLAYHEPGAPRLLWLLLLVPLGLLKVVPAGRARFWLQVLKYLVVAALVLNLIPFVAGQVQQVIYPQLESTETGYESLWDGMFEHHGLITGMSDATNASTSLNVALPQANAQAANINAPAGSNGYSNTNSADITDSSGGLLRRSLSKGNLAYDSKVRIQTGPAVPEWSWRTIRFGWSGPVQDSQEIYPILIPLWLHRVLSLVRVVLLITLLSSLLDASRIRLAFARTTKSKTIAAALLGLSLALAGTARAQIPDKDTLATLHDRLTTTSDAYPTAADIPSVALSIRDRRVVMDVEIDAAIPVAVPLPGRLPAWSPVNVLVDGKSDVALRRDDDYLWVALSAGVHQVHVEGLLADVTEWEWTFQLKPHRVTVDAPGWSYSGVRPDGIPEQQVFFTLKQKLAGAEASYDRQNLHTVAALDRHLELGLVWQIHNEVSRLSPGDRAISIRVPLLAGEKVLSSNVTPQDGFIDVRLGASEQNFTWDSELTPTDTLSLATKTDDAWVERWYLVASPVWNVTMSGLAPVFEANATDLIPVWHPWPGEKVDLAIRRPEAISGATVTVHNVRHTVTLGARQRSSQLDLQLQCSLGEDFSIELPSDADITSLQQNGTTIPVRKDNLRVIVPLQPGEQTVSVLWTTNVPLGLDASADQVRLPVESANISTGMTVPQDRWILWTHGPLRGPAVQFWIIIACALIAAQLLARLTLSPLTMLQWALLIIGLTQANLFGLIVVAWLFLLAWRGSESYQKQRRWLYNLSQLLLLGMTGVSLIIFLYVLGAGFLGHPEMFIAGNGSSDSDLQWYQAHADTALPMPGCISVSIWWYRLLMLGWALWLASSLVRWLTWGWSQFSKGGIMASKRAGPPPL